MQPKEAAIRPIYKNTQSNDPLFVASNIGLRISALDDVILARRASYERRWRQGVAAAAATECRDIHSAWRCVVYTVWSRRI